MENVTLPLASIIILVLQAAITLVVTVVGWLIKGFVKGIYLQLR